MREIKFRAFHKVQEGMKIVDIIDIKNRIVTPAEDDSFDGTFKGRDKFEFGDVELMQYTGLFDANLKEIYEGDIVATKRAGLIGTHLHITEARGEVMFGDCNFYIKQTDGIDPLENYSVGFENVVTEIEIIGNIYENPELLED